MPNGTTPQDMKRAALQELRDRALHLHTNIKVLEQQQAVLPSQRSMMSEAMFLQKMAIAEQDIARKQAVLTKWNMMLSANGVTPIGQGIGETGPPNTPSQPGFIPFQNTQGQPAWISGTQQNPGNAMTPQPPHNLAPPSTLQNFAGTPVPPLDRARFQGSYQHFCATKKIMINEAMLNISGKPVDLHALHEEVLQLRATDFRMAPNFWHIIGWKLGFSFGEEQASSEVAVQVATIYKQFLHKFDTIYIASFIQESQRMNVINSQPGQPL